jgi:conserved oligomeric Golgi complex subunit 2
MLLRPICEKNPKSYFSPFSRSHPPIADKVDHISSLERCAQTTLLLVKDLQASTAVVAALTANKVAGSTSQQKDGTGSGPSGPSAPGGHAGNKSSSNPTTTSLLPSLRTPLEDDTERAQFLMKLAPRIRRLESGTINALTYRMEQILQLIQERRRRLLQAQDDGTDTCTTDKFEDEEGNESDLLLMMGHCMRGLALLGRGKEIENIFARVAIMYVFCCNILMNLFLF